MTGSLRERLRGLASRLVRRASGRPAERLRVVCLETGVVYESAEAAACDVGTAKLGILNCIEGSQLSAGGRHWAPEGSDLTIEQIEAGRKLKRRDARRVVCLETGEVFESEKAAAESVGSEASSIRACVDGKVMTVRGLHWALEGSDADICSIESTRKLASAKPVTCLETGETFESAVAAAKALGLKSGKPISNCINGTTMTGGGFHWVTEGSDLTIERIEAGRKCRGKSVVCLETGEVFGSLEEAARVVGMKDGSSISSCLNGRTLTAGGCHWALEGSGMTIESAKARRDGRSKRVVCIETGVVYESLATAAKAVGLKNGASLSNCLRGKAMTAGGFHWVFADGDPD